MSSPHVSATSTIRGPALSDGARAGLLWMIYLVWLPFVIPPAIAQLRSGITTQTVLTLLGAALFVAVYVWTAWDTAHVIMRALPSPARPLWRMWLPIAVMTLLSVALTVASGLPWMALFIFTCASAGGRFAAVSLARAVGAVVVLILLAGCVGALVLGGQDAFLQSAFLMVFVGATVIGTMRSILATLRANRALRVARDEIARLAVAEERLRFARDLHDLLGHTLSLITLKSELAGRLAVVAPERAVAEIGDVEHAARAALREVREAVAGYRQPSLAHELQAAQEILAAAGIGFCHEGISGEVPAAIEAVLSWTVREGVTNVIRHSRARRCMVRITRREQRVAVEVTDDGCAPARTSIAPSSNKDSGGSGLHGLAERARALDGRFEAGARAHGGFRLAVSLPIEPVAAASDVSVGSHSLDGEGREAS